jgi:hypothetical protein
MFLLTPGGSSTGIVLFVLGIGVWLGVQHLGYHEFFEIRRLAQRTMEQKQVIVNNVAIRKAAGDLAKAQSYQELYQILQQAFASNDFDGFLLNILSEPLQQHGYDADSQDKAHWYRWRKPIVESKQVAVWTLTLDLMSPDQRQLGYFLVYNTYNNSNCMVDVNLLISELQKALAVAISRIMKATEAAYAKRMEASIELSIPERSLQGAEEFALREA